MDIDNLTDEQKAAFRASLIGRWLAADLKLGNAKDAHREAEQAFAARRRRIAPQVEDLQRQRDVIDSEIEAANSEIVQAQAVLDQAAAAVVDAQAESDALEAEQQ